MTGDGVRAWQFLRRNRSYRTAWLRRRPQPGLAEPGPFAVRMQTATDLAAARFGLLAWEDPFRDDGPASPFWAVAPMADAMARPGAVPLVALAAAGGASLAGLRAADGALVLKVERRGAAVQIRIRDGTRFPHGDGLALVREVERIEELWDRAGAPAPPRGRGRGTRIASCSSRSTAILRAGACAGSPRICGARRG